ncbi:MAG: biotin/lipoyl-binding protein [Marinobacter sp.]|nr:biotin/lipoyl-binding protein [Marinobacter sp.]
MRRFVPVLVIAIGIAGFALLRLTRPAPDLVSPQERSWRVEVLTAQLQPQAPVLHLYGQLTAPDQVQLVAPLAGRVAARPVVDGQRVEAGALLFALDERDIQAVVAQAEAELADARAQLASERVRQTSDRQALVREQAILDSARRQQERTESLVNRNLASREALDAVTDNLTRAELTVTQRQRATAEAPYREASLQARVTRAEANLASVQRDAILSRAEAPFAGVVSQVRVAPGDRVAPQQPLLTLYPVDGLELRALIPQQYTMELSQALESGLVLWAGADSGQRFRLQGLAGEGSPAGTEARLLLDGEPVGLRPGVMVPVQLQRPTQPALLALPYSALYGSDVIYVVDDSSRMRRLQIQRVGELLRPDGERWILVQGADLQDGLPVILTHLPNAITGLKVEVVGAEP